MKTKLPIITHTWSVTGTVPDPDQRHPHYGQNVSIGIQSESMEIALVAARKAYPEIQIFGCHHRGEVNIQCLSE